MTAAATYVETEADRESARLAMTATLEDIDRSQTSAAAALAHVRAVRRSAQALDESTPRRLNIRTYDIEEPGEPSWGGLGLPESAQVVLDGSYREPVRELIAACDAAEAELVRFDQKCEEDRARVESDLRGTRG